MVYIFIYSQLSSVILHIYICTYMLKWKITSADEFGSQLKKLLYFPCYANFSIRFQDYGKYITTLLMLHLICNCVSKRVLQKKRATWRRNRKAIFYVTSSHPCNIHTHTFQHANSLCTIFTLSPMKIQNLYCCINKICNLNIQITIREFIFSLFKHRVIFVVCSKNNGNVTRL